MLHGVRNDKNSQETKSIAYVSKITSALHRQLEQIRKKSPDIIYFYMFDANDFFVETL